MNLYYKKAICLITGGFFNYIGLNQNFRQKKMGKLTASHRYNLTPLLHS